MKTHTFYVIAGIIITGVVAYSACRHFCKAQNEDCKKDSASSGGINNAPDVPASEEVHAPTTTDIYGTREAIAYSVRGRHREAANAMEQSLNTIFNDSENDDIETENSQVLRETSSGLDDLLK